MKIYSMFVVFQNIDGNLGDGVVKALLLQIGMSQDHGNIHYHFSSFIKDVVNCLSSYHLNMIEWFLVVPFH